MLNTTTNDMLDQVRSLIDEDNETSVSNTDILNSINRAQKYALNILARQYEEPLLANFELPIVNGQNEYDLPKNMFEDRIEKVEFSTFQGTFTEVQRLSYRDISIYESDMRSNVPTGYAVIKKRIRIIPTPSGTYNARVWYLKKPKPLVTSQGRITVVNPDNNYIIIDSVGEDLTTEQDNLNSYVNIVDWESGEIKYSAQIKIVDNNKITFKSTPSRSSVAGMDIGSDFSSLVNDNGDEISINEDDLICAIKGTCIPEFQDPISNFMIEYAVAEMTRKMGGPVEGIQRTLDKFEEQVERTWVGRESTTRVKKRNKHYRRNFRRGVYPSNGGSGN
jgi:hypothetical protein